RCRAGAGGAHPPAASRAERLPCDLGRQRAPPARVLRNGDAAMILVPQHKIDDYTARGWWGRVTLWELFRDNLAAHPGDEAVVDAPNRADFAHGAPRRLTWAQLGAEVDRFCLLLLAEDIRRDEVMVVQLPNCIEQFVVYLACARLGIIVS